MLNVGEVLLLGNYSVTWSFIDLKGNPFLGDDTIVISLLSYLEPGPVLILLYVTSRSDTEVPTLILDFRDLGLLFVTGVRIILIVHLREDFSLKRIHTLGSIRKFAFFEKPIELAVQLFKVSLVQFAPFVGLLLVSDREADHVVLDSTTLVEFRAVRNIHLRGVLL